MNRDFSVGDIVRRTFSEGRYYVELFEKTNIGIIVSGPLPTYHWDILVNGEVRTWFDGSFEMIDS